jgi:hypothetical protein
LVFYVGPTLLKVIWRLSSFSGGGRAQAPFHALLQYTPNMWTLRKSALKASHAQVLGSRFWFSISNMTINKGD